LTPFLGVRRIMCIGASRLPPQASSSASHSLDFFGLVTDTAPLSQSSESERKGQRLTACGSEVGQGLRGKHVQESVFRQICSLLPAAKALVKSKKNRGLANRRWPQGKQLEGNKPDRTTAVRTKGMPRAV
jgi:hypothetical protein